MMMVMMVMLVMMVMMAMIMIMVMIVKLVMAGTIVTAMVTVIKFRPVHRGGQRSVLSRMQPRNVT